MMRNEFGDYVRALEEKLIEMSGVDILRWNESALADETIERTRFISNIIVQKKAEVWFYEEQKEFGTVGRPLSFHGSFKNFGVML